MPFLFLRLPPAARALTALAALLLASAATAQSAPAIARYSGMCDASAAVALGSKLFVVANDEDNVLRMYRRDTPGKPVQTLDLTAFLKTRPNSPEADIEGAARIGDRIYWIASHGRNKDGKPRPNRHRLFATEVKTTGNTVTLTPIGTPYTHLLDDLSQAPGLRDLKLRQAAKKAPESTGGLNIEGLAATPQGTLLIAFRNPIPGGQALIVPLDNPQDVINGKAAKLGQPILLPLAGHGIRDIAYFEAWGGYLMIAGPVDDNGDFKLYRWSGAASAQPEALRGLDFRDLHPEALAIYPGDQSTVQVISDDGAAQVAGKDCKDITINPEQKNFRSVWVTL